MRETSGIIINDDIFINSNHVVKIEKSKKAEGEYVITIYLSESSMSNVTPVLLTFDSENKCAEAFKKIIQEMYGFEYAIVNVPSVIK